MGYPKRIYYTAEQKTLMWFSKLTGFSGIE